MEELVLIGFGGHAKSMADSIEKAGIYHIAGYTDPENRCEYHGYNGWGQMRICCVCFKMEFAAPLSL